VRKGTINDASNLKWAKEVFSSDIGPTSELSVKKKQQLDEHLAGIEYVSNQQNHAQTVVPQRKKATPE
jgi:hypothetical protein